MRAFIFILALLGAFFPIPVQAQEAKQRQQWAEFKERLENLSAEDLTDEERCQATWDMLWPEAKKGNLEARAWLFQIIMPWPHMVILLMPGKQQDIITRFRDGLINRPRDPAPSGSLAREPLGKLVRRLAHNGSLLL